MALYWWGTFPHPTLVGGRELGRDVAVPVPSGGGFSPFGAQATPFIDERGLIGARGYQLAPVMTGPPTLGPSPMLPAVSPIARLPALVAPERARQFVYVQPHSLTLESSPIRPLHDWAPVVAESARAAPVRILRTNAEITRAGLALFPYLERLELIGATGNGLLAAAEALRDGPLRAIYLEGDAPRYETPVADFLAAWNVRVSREVRLGMPFPPALLEQVFSYFPNMREIGVDARKLSMSDVRAVVRAINLRPGRPTTLLY